MPYSHEEGKDWMVDRITARAPKSILDVGVGAGIYAQLLRPRLPGTCLIGIEVFEPYRAMFHLDDLYDELLIGDARTIPWPKADVVIMGDVVEHMPADDAQLVWSKARDAAQEAVYVSVPIINYPQGAHYGNEHECHVQTLTHDQMLEYPGVVAYWAGAVLGCYEVKPT
jgi:hypothetical protein